MTQKTFDRQSAKFIARVIENLPDLSGTEMQFLVDNPSLLQLKLYDALVPKSRQINYKKVWKVVEVSTKFRLTLSEIEKSFHEQNMEICSLHAKEMISKLWLLSPSNAVVHLACTTPRDLGFKKAPKLNQLYERANDVGLGLCSHELAISLRLDYKDQPKDDFLRIAMTPIDAKIFYLAHIEEGGEKENEWRMFLGAKDGIETDFDNRYELDKKFIFTIK